jgi:hypothetical protein
VIIKGVPAVFGQNCGEYYQIIKLSLEKANEAVEKA